MSIRCHAGHGIALISAIILVYLIMVALYDSYVYPLVVLFSIPLAIIGALLALALAAPLLVRWLESRVHRPRGSYYTAAAIAAAAWRAGDESIEFVYACDTYCDELPMPSLAEYYTWYYREGGENVLHSAAAPFVEVADTLVDMASSPMTLVTDADRYRPLDHLVALTRTHARFSVVVGTAGGRWVTAHGTALDAGRAVVVLLGDAVHLSVHTHVSSPLRSVVPASSGCTPRSSGRVARRTRLGGDRTCTGPRRRSSPGRGSGRTLAGRRSQRATAFDSARVARPHVVATPVAHGLVAREVRQRRLHHGEEVPIRSRVEESHVRLVFE